MQKTQPQKCWIPFCAAEKSDSVRLFYPPLQNPQLCQQWKDSFSHVEGFDPFNVVVCSKHFEDRFIVKEDIIEEAGMRISIPRTNWTLTEGAIPTIFEGQEQEKADDAGADAESIKSDQENESEEETGTMLNLAADIFEKDEEPEETEDVEMDSLSQSGHASSTPKKLGRPKKTDSKSQYKKVLVPKKRGRRKKPVAKPKPLKRPGKPNVPTVVTKKLAKTTAKSLNLKEVLVESVVVAPSPVTAKKPFKRQTKRKSNAINTRKASKISRNDDSADAEAVEAETPTSRLRSSLRKRDLEIIEPDPEPAASLPKSSKRGPEPEITPTRNTITPNGSTIRVNIPAVEPTLLRLGQTGYDLNYIYKLKHKFQLPRLNKWVFELLTDKSSSSTKELIYVGEMVSRNEELILQRVIKVFDGLTFKVETNGADVTSMFSERGTRIDTLRKLQDIINDLAAFQVCLGWTGFESVVDFELGKKFGGIWYSKDCESLKLKSDRCGPCSLIGAALMFRRARINQVRGSSGLSIQDQISLLPANDPLRLQFQVDELIEETNELKRKLRVSQGNGIKSSKQLGSTIAFNYKTGLLGYKSPACPPSKITPAPCPASKRSQPVGITSKRTPPSSQSNNVPACPASKKNIASKTLHEDKSTSSSSQVVTNGGYANRPLPPSMAKPASSSIVRPRRPNNVGLVPADPRQTTRMYTPLVRPPVATAVPHNIINLSGEAISNRSLLTTLQQMHPGKTIRIVNPSVSSTLAEGDGAGKNVVLLRKKISPSEIVGNDTASTFITLD